VWGWGDATVSGTAGGGVGIELDGGKLLKYT